MRHRPTAAVLAPAGLIALAVVIAVGGDRPPASPLGPERSAGEVRLMRNVDPDFGAYVAAATPATERFVEANFDLIRGFSPFQDRALDWGLPTTAYLDLYAIYNQRDADPGRPDLDELDANPDWVLRDGAGRPLYIQFDCDGESCPQLAADPGSAGWRADLIERALSLLDRGYAGIYLDDVNMEIRVSDGSGEQVVPVDPRTGEEMRLEDWRRYVAELTELVRGRAKDRFPAAIISHNPLWFVPEEDPWIERQTDAADLIQLERGFNDRGLTGGAGTFSYQRYLEHVDWLHARGRAVIYKPELLDRTSRVFELASYLLVNEGRDLIAPEDFADPDRFWNGWRTDLGEAAGGRELGADGLWRRRFEHGLVIVNPPQGARSLVELERPMIDLDGVSLTELTLPGRSGAVLRAP